MARAAAKESSNVRASKGKALDPIELLKGALAERCRRNPQYSIRSFARSSGISHTVLSLALSGKRRLSKKASEKLADYLGLDPQSRQALAKFYRKPETTEFRTLSLDAFEVISDWYHYAILSVLELPDAKLEPRWIASTLKIKILEAKLAIERLKRLGLVAEDKNGKWKQTGLPIKIENSISTSATRRFHKQLLEKAAEAIDLYSVEERDHSSMTIAMDPSLIPFARERIRQFRRELAAELEAKGQPKTVYNFTLQLYPVTPTGKEN